MIHHIAGTAKIFLPILTTLFVVNSEAKFTTNNNQNFDFNFGADINLEQTYFPKTIQSETDDHLSKFELQALADLKYKDSWRVLLHPYFLFNPQSTSDTEKFFIDPQDCSVKFIKNEFSLKIGYNIISWGVTDGYNPVDIINKKQLFNPLNSKKIGTLSILISETLPFFEYDLIYIPNSETSVLPGQNSRWLPREIFIPQVPNNDLELILPSNLRYHYGSRTSLNDALKDNFALRLQKNTSLGDLSLSAYDGAATVPIIEPVVSGTIIQVAPKTVITVDPNVVLNLKDYRIREVGFSIVAHPGTFLIKYATSYLQSVGNYANLPGWTHENILALEKHFNFMQGHLTAILQHSFLLTDKQNDSNISLLGIFHDAWMIGGRVDWHDIWNSNFLLLFDNIHSSHLEEFSISRRLFDTWSLNFTATFISGSNHDPLGIFNKNQSTKLSLSRSF